jgi:hypothetical protein
VDQGGDALNLGRTLSKVFQIGGKTEPRATSPIKKTRHRGRSVLPKLPETENGRYDKRSSKTKDYQY